MRQLRDAGGKLPGPVTVWVRGGKYFLDETLVLGPEDSGTRKCPVTWQAYPGETPVLSGGTVVAAPLPDRPARRRLDQRCGHIIRFNTIADTLGCEAKDGQVGRMGEHGAPATGIYLDNETSHCLVYDNIVVRAGNCGIVVHMGKNNLIENNIIVDCPAGIRFQEPVARGLEYYWRFLGYMTGNLVRRNIICPAVGSRVYLSLDGWTERLLADCDQNLIHLATAGDGDGAGPVVDLEPFMPDKHRELTLADWQAMGYDHQAVVADPLFVDPANDDYRLRPGSPALELGFEPIPVEQIGIRRATR